MARLASMKDRIAVRKDEFSKIASEIVKCAKRGAIVGYLDADRRFHIGLLEILENDQLTAIIENLRDQSRQYGLKALSASGTLVKSAEEHQPILDALVAGDQKLTSKLMTEHLGHLVTDWA
jgi:DNA-binding GntR family transcriptional regulator